MQSGLLPRFFDRVTRQVFADLGLDDTPVAGYLTGLLTRFARTDALYRVDGLPGRRIETVVESLQAIEGAWQIDSPDFAPEREQALRLHVGDFTLFMSGIFRDHVERLGISRHYEDQGRRAYRFVAETARTEGRADAEVYRRLAHAFEQYAGALSYMQKVYFRDQSLPWSGLRDTQVRRLVAE